MNDLEKAAEQPAELATRDSADADTGGSLVARLARRALLGHLARIRTGRLQVRDVLGSHSFGDPAPDDLDISVRVTDLSAWLEIAAGGTIGAAEAYMRGHLLVNDLPGLIRLFLRNQAVMDSMDGGMARLGRPLLKAAHWYHRNTRTGSRRNIQAHYDLGNELFELFLDPTMMYSSAVFPREDASLEEASLHKLDLICRRLDLKPTDHLLEIGTGWGGLAIHAASRYGCRVTTTTISRNQFEYATARIRQAGLADRITVISEDYRDLKGQFDKLVSVEMIEAVGHRFLDAYFRVCSERLKPAGRMLLQAIVIADRRYEHARRSVDFIQKYIFPGGALPSLGAILASVGRVTDLQLSGMQDIGADYARTLQLWRERFLERLTEVRCLGFPEEFIRRWEWYLAYCEGGFRERAISDVHLVFDKPDCRLAPMGAGGNW
jgi:cyclopropane-fatty-acyl-phospholipid synthase